MPVDPELNHYVTNTVNIPPTTVKCKCGNIYTGPDCLTVMKAHMDVENAVAPTFRKELEELINKHGLESVSDTPDFILASFLAKCLEAFDGCVVERDRWHGWRDGEPGQGGPLKKWQEEI